MINNRQPDIFDIAVTCTLDHMLGNKSIVPDLPEPISQAVTDKNIPSKLTPSDIEFFNSIEL